MRLCFNENHVLNATSMEERKELRLYRNILELFKIRKTTFLSFTFFIIDVLHSKVSYLAPDSTNRSEQY